MKIICMDCHTESCIEIEQLKDKKRLVCEHCSKNLQLSSANQTEEQIYSPAADALDFQSVAASEPLSEKGISLFGEEEVLEIPFETEMAQSPDPDELLPLPIYDDLNSPAVEETPSAVSLGDDPVKAQAFAPESPRQFFSTFTPAAEASTQQTPDLSRPSSLAEVSVCELETAPNRVKLLSVKSSILMAASVAFVLFIALGEKIIRPASKPSPLTENSSPVITPKQDVKTTNAATSSAQPETAGSTQPESPEPNPTPAAQVSETKPRDVEVAPSASQPPSIAAAAGQFTIQVGSHNNVEQANEQAAKLNAAGFEPRIVSVDIPKRGRWYRVQSGSFANRDEANRYGSQVLAKGAAGTFVVSGL
jgi:cell division protein FtsN